jgi:predicted ATPase
MHKTRGGNDMNIYFERLGFINKGELNLNGFTLLCGPNNTGKTYAMYSLYGLLNNNFEVHFEFLADVLRQLAAKNVYQVDLRDLMAQHFDSMIRQIEDSFHKQLPRLFSVEESDFLNTKIKLTFDRDALLQRATDNEWKTKLSFGKEKDWFLYIEKAANQTGEKTKFFKTIEELIQDFFASENFTLPPNQTWQHVKANIFQVVDGKKLLFKKPDCLFQRVQEKFYGYFGRSPNFSLAGPN